MVALSPYGAPDALREFPCGLVEVGVAEGEVAAGGGDDRAEDQRFEQRRGDVGQFAGGDAVRGADLVVTAVAEGRDAAASIVRLLTR